MYDKNNIFAKIIRREMPANIVHESEKVMAFHTIEPMADIHVLVIPKGEYEDYSSFVSQAGTEEVADFFREVDNIAKKLNIGDSYRLVTNYGHRSGQRVFHFHIHLLAGNIKPGTRVA